MFTEKSAGEFTKKQYRQGEGGLPKKRDLGHFADLRGMGVGGRAKKEGGVFEGGWYPNAHYV